MTAYIVAMYVVGIQFLNLLITGKNFMKFYGFQHSNIRNQILKNVRMLKIHIRSCLTGNDMLIDHFREYQFIHGLLYDYKLSR